MTALDTVHHMPHRGAMADRPQTHADRLYYAAVCYEAEVQRWRQISSAMLGLISTGMVRQRQMEDAENSFLLPARLELENAFTGYLESVR